MKIHNDGIGIGELSVYNERLRNENNRETEGIVLNFHKEDSYDRDINMYFTRKEWKELVKIVKSKL